MITVYILRNAAGRLYVGQTNDLDRRSREHTGSKGAHFVSQFGGGTIVYTETHETLTSARAREQQIKRWSRAKKEALIQGDIEQLKELSRG